MSETNLFSHRQPSRMELLSLSAAEDSLSRRMVPHVARLLDRHGVRTGTTDIRDLPPVWVNGGDLATYPAGYRELHGRIEAADGVILFVPVHGYTMSAPAKAVVDLVGGALAHKPVAILAAAGSVRSTLAMRDLMSSLAFEQETLCWPRATIVTAEDFDAQGQPNADAASRTTQMIHAFLLFATRLQGLRFAASDAA